MAKKPSPKRGERKERRKKHEQKENKNQKKEHKQTNNKPKTQYKDRRYNPYTQTTHKIRINAPEYQINTNWPKHPRTSNPPPCRQ